MTTLLEEAIRAMAELPAERQDALAAWILEELKAEQSWDLAFAQSQDQLAKLAEQAREDLRAGRGRHMYFDELLADPKAPPQTS